MGLTTGNFPPVEPATFMQQPYRERTKMLARHWVDYGFGAPKITGLIYIVKLLFFYALGGVLVATLTSGLDPLDPAAWWDEPIVYQKLVLWTVLLECLGVAGSWGPLAGHFKPLTAGWRHYARPGTIRLPPWPDKVPFTRGDERTAVDVGALPRAAREPRRRARGAVRRGDGLVATARDRPDHRRCSSRSACATRSSSSPRAASSTCRR